MENNSLISLIAKKVHVRDMKEIMYIDSTNYVILRQLPSNETKEEKIPFIISKRLKEVHGIDIAYASPETMKALVLFPITESVDTI